jgi:hypothetical protein
MLLYYLRFAAFYVFGVLGKCHYLLLDLSLFEFGWVIKIKVIG